MGTDFIDIHVNCPDRDSARRIADELIGAHLVACANILAPVSSTYRWKGAVEQAEEVPLVLKSRRALFDAVAARVRDLHPHEVPSIVATELPLVERNYAVWLEQETRGAA
jgi:periplasmic divalent cation tolerance protein